jgi:hypothetical protein
LIFIAAQFRVRPADADAWPEIVRPFTEATQQDLPPHLAETPRIVNVVVPGTEWSLLGELAVDGT